MDVLIKIGQFMLSFSLLVFVHELGHYLFARLFGVRVDKFYIFFNPGFSLFKKKIGDTEYGIGWIPFGGYCKIAGMIDESMDTEQMKQPAQPWELRSRPPWQRLLVMLGGIIMNVLLALMIYIGMSWKYGESYVANEDLAYGWTFSEYGQEIGFRNGDRILSIDGRPVDAAAEVFPELAISNAPLVRILRDGQEVELKIPEEAVPHLLNNLDFMSYRIPFVIRGMEENGNAHTAGLMPGDSLVAADSINMVFFDQYTEYLGNKRGETVLLTVVRHDGDTPGGLVTLPVEVSTEGRIGVEVQNNLARFYPVRVKNYTFLQAVPAGIKMTGGQISGYWRQLKLLVSPKTEAYKSIRGPLGIYEIFPSTWNWQYFWLFTGFLSIVLAIMNLLPIPGLDGGHVVFVLYEMITRRKPGEKFMEYSTLVGLLLILGLMLLATGNDLIRIFTK